VAVASAWIAMINRHRGGDRSVADVDDPGEPRPDDSAGESADDSADDSIEGLAAFWLESERTAVAVGNANNTEERGPAGERRL